MELKVLRAVVLGGWVLGSGLPLLGPQASEIPWRERPVAAFSEAADSSRPVVVDLWAVWCEPCKVMEETTYKDARVVEMLGAFVPLKLNVDANEQFVARYSIDSYPTTLFLDGNGDEIGRLAGLIEADPMVEALGLVRDGYDDYLASIAKRDDPEALRAAAGYLITAGNEDGATRLLRSALKIARKNAPETLDAIELDLARTLVAEGRHGAAVKAFERLAVSASSEEIRGQALLRLVRVERERGREAKALEALSRLTEEHPELAATFGTEH